MKIRLLYLLAVISFGLFSFSKGRDTPKTHQLSIFKASSSPFESSEIMVDSITIRSFFHKYPQIANYESQVFSIYRLRQYQPIWFHSGQLNELGQLLLKKASSLSEEGLRIKMPYQEKLDWLLLPTNEELTPNSDTELLIASLYFFYTQQVFLGLEDRTATDLAWYIPRKTQSYVSYLDTLIKTPDLLSENESKMFKQYYRLKDALKKCREIEAKGKWQPIVMSNSNPIAVGSSSVVVLKVRERLHLLGYLKSTTNSLKYDKELSQSVWKYKKNLGLTVDDLITSRLVASLNVPISDRISSIEVSMERCRWISSDFNRVKEYIFINIPSYQMNYIKEGKTLLNSKVVVGKVMNQTVIFSGMLQYVVFSPYWNVPKSIIDKEITPAIKKNKNYLAQHNMEWNDGAIRQKPGPRNSLGLVKFLFPNSNSIYLHDTPSKSLFNEEKRAFSHGCIRLEKPIELAYLLVKDDKSWTMEKLNKAFHSEKEIWYTLKNKIPVYIGYFTSWVDDEGDIHFYDDVYSRDQCLINYLNEEK